ncbi:hypothetical protein PHMEG_00017997 [Phytophthora megakarya]|uniref:Bacterial Pleckstrin homology domain-containing protein n=1 Tax=Phytophthora megakarya TaxID=4795 RepID=A0A225VUX0_9STRA|nr:hypothetical protein PHMEG_00017997 [Phytophthora megakarya]
MGNTNSAIKGLASDIAGTTDICDVVADLSSAWAASYLLPEEEILYALQSRREEFAFTNRALVKVESVKFESTGVVDRDCELQFKIGEHTFKLDIVRDKEDELKGFYKALLLLGHKQEENELEWQLAQQAVATAKDTVRLSDAGAQSLNQQSDETLGWMKAQYERTHPHCYKTLIKGVLDAERVQTEKEE